MYLPFNTSACLLIVTDFSRFVSKATMFLQFDIDEVRCVTANLLGDYSGLKLLIVYCTIGASKNDYPEGLVSFILFDLLILNYCYLVGG